MATTTATSRARRSDGERSRRAILAGAAELATVEGLGGLSIGRLADHIGMSKSGLYAHFGSKEELQLATIDTAAEIFDREVTGPALAQPSGVAQLRALGEAFLSHLERRVFPGGCFFAAAAAEFDTHDGRVKEKIRGSQQEFMKMLEQLVEDAKDRGELDSATDAAQLAFEFDSLLLGANATFVLTESASALERARRGLERCLQAPPLA